MSLVNLVCVKVGSKLRVRIVSYGYKPDANSQFPRNLRVEGRKFTVPSTDVTLVKRGATYFYSVRAANVKIVDGHGSNEISEEYKTNLKIFGESEDTDCVVCMCESKDAVFGPCGHFSCCKGCSLSIQSSSGKCPMCRTHIVCVIDYDELK